MPLPLRPEQRDQELQLIWRRVCQGGRLKFRREAVSRTGELRGVSGGRDVGLGDGVASLKCGDSLTPWPCFCCRWCTGLGTSVAPVGLLIAVSCVPAAVSARRPGLLSRGAAVLW